MPLLAISGAHLFPVTQSIATMQGRGPKTHAYTHSLEHNHHMFMKLANGKVRDGWPPSPLAGPSGRWPVWSPPGCSQVDRLLPS